jgi:hypothetical protein
MATEAALVDYYASKGLSEPERRVELNERVADAGYAASDAIDAYSDGLSAQLEGRPRGARGTLDIDAVASRARTAVQDLEDLHREVRGFLANNGDPATGEVSA